MFDKSGAVPLYEQLYRHLRHAITRGDIGAGEKLPSKRQLSTHLKISQNTVTSAYDQLVAEGYITAKPRSGFYAARLEKPLAPPSLSVSPAPAPVVQTSPQWRWDFTTNTVDATFFPFPTWARISREVLSEKNDALLQAVDPQGYYPLRASICRYIGEYRGVHCTPEQMVIGAGSEVLLGLIVQLLGRSLTYGMENPHYNKVYNVLASNGANTRLIALDREGIRLDAIADSGAQIIHTTPSHQFPLGIVMPVKRRMALLRWAASSPGRMIIEDDYDSEFRFSGRPIPALQGLDQTGSVIYMNTFTRNLAPSMRISYMVLPPALIKKYREKLSFYSSTVSRFEQHTLHRFIAEGHFERHLNRMRKIYRARRDALLTAIRNAFPPQRVSVSGADAGLHVLLTVHTSRSEAQLVRLAKAAGIRVTGLSSFYAGDPLPPSDPVIVLGYAG
ncbi:MAG: PLP-dependent aminotransferase family protein, partial [Eubacteriaceae bacterium]|nr:PLP-dependent aminotransferase family protein [Eubacteriaceae bacterium]